jgi:glucose-6-phosphate isomerase
MRRTGAAVRGVTRGGSLILELVAPSQPEIFDVWQGGALIYMQEQTGDDPGRCIAVEARPGDRVVVPPASAHAVISANRFEPLVFGAWCDRDYGFVYKGVRSRGGLAWFPLVENESISWTPNGRYRQSELQVHRARSYPELNLDSGIPALHAFETKTRGHSMGPSPDLMRCLGAFRAIEEPEHGHE